LPNAFLECGLPDLNRDVICIKEASNKENPIWHPWVQEDAPSMLKIMKFMLLGYTILFIFVKTKVVIPIDDFNKISVKI
jgi:hypothetical protein